MGKRSVVNGRGSGRVANGPPDLTRPRPQSAVRYVKLVMGVFGPLEVLLGAFGSALGVILGAFGTSFGAPRPGRERKRRKMKIIVSPKEFLGF